MLYVEAGLLHLCSATMKAILCALYLGAVTFGTMADDLIKYQSPDGKFAMLLTEADDQEVSIKLIEAGSRNVVLHLTDTGDPYSQHPNMLWSQDSKRFAFFEDNRRGRLHYGLSAQRTSVRRSKSSRDLRLQKQKECRQRIRGQCRAQAVDKRNYFGVA